MTTALTFSGWVEIEPGVPLGQLSLGDVVLGLPDPDDPSGPRTTHAVTAVLGQHYVPSEDPAQFERFLIKARLERLIAGPKVEGVLVNGVHGPGLFALMTTPVLDRMAER